MAYGLYLHAQQLATRSAQIERFKGLQYTTSARYGGTYAALEATRAKRTETRNTFSASKGAATARNAGQNIAKAEGDMVTIGGYQSLDAKGKPIRHSEAKWFYIELDRVSAPWALARGNHTAPLHRWNCWDRCSGQ